MSDCQTTNFDIRIGEAQLLASFREQGLLVEQPFEAPDFRLANRLGGEAWVEAAATHEAVPYNHGNAPFGDMPTDIVEIFFGAAALPFAKTIGSKLARRYDQLPHVVGKPFVLAVADFQASHSMLWSREGLIGYLHGLGATAAEIDGQMQTVPMPAEHMLGRPREFLPGYSPTISMPSYQL